MNGNALGQPTILQPGQMPMQGQNFQYAGFPHGDGSPVMTPGGGGGGGPPQGVGMVPGVPGSMGLNPGMGGPIHGQQGAGVPFQGGTDQWQAPHMGGGLRAQFGRQGGGFGQIMQLPQFQSLMQSPEMQAFLQGHPRFQQILSQGGYQAPQNALAPPMLPPTAAPAMPVNPGMSASTNPNQYGLPTYGG